MTNNRLFELFELYQQDAASEAETNELMQLLENTPDEELIPILNKSWNKMGESKAFFSTSLREKMLAKMQPAADETLIQHIGTTRRHTFLRIAAAAAIVLVLSITAFLLVRKENNGIVKTQGDKPAVNTAIVPGGDRAILTLADGRQIVLDTATDGALAQQGGIKVIKIGGQLTYDVAANSSEVVFNTVSTPKGGQYQLVLADGTKVWLNAASSLRFPSSFMGKERTVELTGEGYFEVAHNAKMPFHVKVNEMDVQVLGTHFNINSYSNEPSLKTTLLEGRVLVKANDKQVFLNPRQQAIIQPEQDNITLDNDVNVEEVVAWKNGLFLFTSASIESIMRQVERWYDVDVIYEKKTAETFSGDLPRSANISQLIKILEATGKVEIKINGKQIVVKPQ